MRQGNEGLASATVDDVARWLICRAASAAPESFASRLEEEWLADLEFRCSALSRLRLALGCCWATAVIARDMRSRVPAAAAVVVAAGGSLVRVDGNVGYFSLRSGTLFLILGLHAALFCGLGTTLSQARGVVVPIEMAVLPGR